MTYWKLETNVNGEKVTTVLASLKDCLSRDELPLHATVVAHGYEGAEMSAKRVDCVIVPSERDPGLVSIRFAGGGKAGTLKRALTDAGFKAGDKVTIVPLKKELAVRK